jgi:hypothetical protein
VGLGAYIASSETLLSFIQRAIFLAFTTLPRSTGTDSRLLVSTSFLCCCFLTIAFISLGLTCLSWPHWLKRCLYCRILQRLKVTV